MILRSLTSAARNTNAAVATPTPTAIASTRAAGRAMAALVLCATFGSGLARAQNSGGQEPSSTPATTTTSTSVELSPDPITLPSVGLTMRMPVGTSVTKNPQATRRILALAGDKSWISEVSVIRTTTDDIPIERIVDGAIETADDESTEMSVIERKTLLVNDERAEQIRFELTRNPTTSRVAGAREVRVHTVFKPTPNTFVVHTFFVGVENAERKLAINDAMVKSIEFNDLGEMAAERLEAIEATEAILTELTESDYRRLIIPERWFRIYRSGEDGTERETGYYRIQERIGMRGEVSVGRSSESYSPAEREEGLLVLLTARYLLETGLVDVEFRSWMAFDRENEVFAISSAQYELVDPSRRGAKAEQNYRYASTATVTGYRSRALITIVTDVPPMEKETKTFQRSVNGYLSQAETYMIYRLLKPFEHTHYGMFAFETSRQRLEYRVEEITPSETPGRFTARQTRYQDAPPNTLTIDGDGRILRIVNVNGEVTVPSSPEEIRKLWTGMNLPTGSLRAERSPRR